MKPLTAIQRRALHLASHKGGCPVSTARPLPKGSVSSQTALRLEDAGWATRVHGTLLITGAGRKALSAVLPPEPAVFLRLRDGLTTRMDLRVPGEPEVLTPGPGWADRAEGRRRLAVREADGLRLSGLPHPEDEIAVLRRIAAERGVDVKDELRYVEHAKRQLERKVRRTSEEAA